VIKLDGGAVYMGFKGDVARTAFITEASSKVKQIYSALEEAQEAVVDEIKPRITPAELHEIGVNIVRKSGTYGEYKRGMIGHSIGRAREHSK